MKIITLNIAHRDDLAQGYSARIQQIASFLDEEQADIVCLQAATFTETESQADEINHMMERPYIYVESELSKKCKVADVAYDQRSAGMRELYARDTKAFFTDGQAVMSNFPIEKTEKVALVRVAPDINGRLDRHLRVAQNIDFKGGVKVSNIHLAANNNSYQQLKELIGKIDDGRLIVGDLNMTHQHMKEHQSIWHKKYHDSLDFLDYVSFPSDGVAYDHLLVTKNYEFVSIQLVDGLSDHSAVIFEIEKK